MSLSRRRIWRELPYTGTAKPQPNVVNRRDRDIAPYLISATKFWRRAGDSPSHLRREILLALLIILPILLVTR
jgi:hypothetical protein